MPKLKTHSGAKKRFNLTKTGKVKRAHAFKSHILTKKPTKRTRNLRKKFLSERRMRHFTATETYSDFDSVAIVQELDCAFDLGIEVVGVDARGHANLLDLDDLLVLSSFLFLLELLEPELAVVHDLADRGNGVRRNLDQIEIFFFGQRQSSGGRHNTKLIAFSSDHAEFLVPDFLVDLMF